MLEKIFKRKLTTEEKTKYITFITSLFDVAVGAIEIIMGIFFSSVFLIISAIYTLLMGIIKQLCIQAIDKDEKKQLILCTIASVLIILSSIFYALYNVRLLYGDSPKDFGLIGSITIAAFAFTKITLAIINIVKYYRKQRCYRIIKLVNFISALTNIVLTQMSLLMAVDPSISQSYNAYFGIAIGIIGVILGINSLRKRKKTQEIKQKEQ